MFVPSPQQAAFIEEARNGTSSLVLIAVAGAGKTSTILKAVENMRGSSVIMAFNRKIADEIAEKLKNAGIDWTKAQAATVHSIGFRNYRKAFPKVDSKPDKDKVAKITAEWITFGKIGPELERHAAVVCHLVSLAKQNGIGIEGQGHIDDVSVWQDIVDKFNLFDSEELEKKSDDLIKLSIDVLKASNLKTDVVDFDDMIYLTLLYNVRCWPYENVWIDEAQDTNTVRRLLAAKVMNTGGRLFAVGDPHQAIYGFTGADNDSLDIIKRTFNAKEMPLTVTYRCPKAVVAVAQNWVNHIQAHPSAPEGKISAESFEDMLKTPARLNGDAAILCRNTKPLVSAAFALIRARIPCRIEGRDIGESLKKLATRWKSVKNIPALEDKLDEWLEKEREKWTKAKKMARVQEAEDKVETLKVVTDACRKQKLTQVSDVVAYIDNIFGDNVSGILTLSTIHRSKGREWSRVYWLDRFNTCPSKYATMDWEREQEKNLQYVAAPRAMNELIDLFPPMKRSVNDNKQEAKAEKIA